MPIELSAETLAGMTPKQRETLVFMEQMTGWTFRDTPPPGSPLARIMALTRAGKAGLITEEECREGVRRIQLESLTDAGPTGGGSPST